MPKRNYSRLLFATCCLILPLFLAGCVSPSARKSQYLAAMQPGSLPELSAYRSGTNLAVRYPVNGKASTAIARWPADTSSPDEYQYYFAVLGFATEEHKWLKALAQDTNRIPIHDSRQWKTLVDGVFQGLMPKEAGHGVLMLVQGQETAVYRDTFGMPHVVKLAEKPANIVIDHAFGQADFSKAAISLLEKTAGKLDPGSQQFLFLTGDDPAFVLVDLRQRLVVCLGFPVDPDILPSKVPDWFPVRAINSLVIRAFVMSAIKNPVTLVSRIFWHIGSSGAVALNSRKLGGATAGSIPPLNKGPGMDLAAWEKKLDKTVSSKRYRGQVQFLIDGEQFYSALIEAVENAKRSVDVLVYIFASDEYAVTVANIFKERSSVARVRVLMDEFGSLFGGGDMPSFAMKPGFTPPGNIKKYLRDHSKVEVRESANPFFTSDHRKCIVVDETQAFVGGMNIGWEYRYEWHDMMMRLTGPIVGRLEKDFDEAWAHAGWLGDLAYAWSCLFDRTHPKRNEVENAIGIRPLRTATGFTEIYRAQLAAIRESKSYIYIENAYFTDEIILRELIKARRRGVDVRVILPAKNDSGVMQTINLLMANEMVRNGIRVFAYPGMTHVKAAIYDGWACLGSANMEKMSLRVSQELDVAFSDPVAVNRLKEDLFEVDFKRAREIMDAVPVHWMDSFIKAFADEI